MGGRDVVIYLKLARPTYWKTALTEPGKSKEGKEKNKLKGHMPRQERMCVL